MDDSRPIAADGPGRWTRRGATVLGVAALVHPAGRVLARLDWRLDLITHFYAAAWIVTLAAVAASRA